MGDVSVTTSRAHCPSLVGWHAPTGTGYSTGAAFLGQVLHVQPGEAI